MTLIISVHLDDAVMSLGRFMSTTPCHVITVLAGIPKDIGVTDYDAACGFSSSTTAMWRRRYEDERACEQLGATWSHWRFFDRQYPGGGCDQYRAVVAALKEQIPEDEEVFGPLGIGHPDHDWVAAAVREAFTDVWFYEELPARILHPEQVFDRFAELDKEGWRRQDIPYPLDQPIGFDKMQALLRYDSQMRGVVDPAMLCPERVWLSTRRPLECE